MRPYRDSTQRWIEFKNDSGSSIGPYAAMRVSGYQQDADTAHQVVLKVAAPNDEAGQSICFNGNKTVAVGKTGYCTFDAPCYAAVSTGGSNGDLYGVEDGNLELVPDDAGAFTYLATVAAGPNGEIVALVDRLGGSSGHKIFTLVSVANDTLTATPIGGTSPSDDLTIAKPYLLRYTPFHTVAYNGITYTYSSATARQGDDGAATEDQIIVPPYVVGDEIIAMAVDGADLNDNGTTLDDVKWMDINVDGRAWAKEA